MTITTATQAILAKGLKCTVKSPFLLCYFLSVATIPEQKAKAEQNPSKS
ncbi:hypothetical protein [Nisaea nitritireducens]|nr:hypothetical protein [Nisaea nitritireducens]